MSEQATTLTYAVRPRVCAKYVGQLCLALAGLTLVSLVASLAFGDFRMSLRYGIVAGGLGLAGLWPARLARPERVQVNEGMVVIALMFLITPLVMTYPMMASGLNFEDAIFETISGATTTGLSTLSSVESAPRTFLFARAWMQWYGGLGIMVLALGLVLQPGLVAKGLAATEVQTDDLAGGVRAHARRVAIVYSLLTLAGIVGLWLLSGNLFESALYTMAAVSTGGFAPHDNSLAGFGGWPVQVGVTLFCLLGAGPLSTYPGLFRKRFKFTPELSQLVAVLFCGLLFSVLFGYCLWRLPGSDASSILLQAPLMVFSAQTTSGFSTLDLSQLDDAAKLALIPSMAIGGGIGSTAGGFKVLRLLVLLRLTQVVLTRLCSPPHAVVNARLAGRKLAPGEINDALLLMLLFAGVILISWLPFVMLGYPGIDSLFEVVSATGTVGLSAGVTGEELPTLLKWILCADMLLGRLEIFAWMVLLWPRTWLERRRS